MMGDPRIGIKASALLYGCIEDISHITVREAKKIQLKTGKTYLFFATIRYDDTAIAALVRDAKTDEAAWSAANSLSELAIARGDAIPEPLREWVIERMRGSSAKSPVTKRPGPSPWRDFERNFNVCMTIATAVSAGQTTTAAIGAAADQHGLTVDNATKIWKRRPPAFRD